MALGEFEQLILLAILRLGEEAHGAPIRRVLAHRGERKVSFGAIYSTLRRLEDKGFVEHRSEPAAGDRGGRPRRIFQVTAEGLEEISAARARFARMAEGLTELGVDPG